jgi:hypothetical protein
VAASKRHVARRHALSQDFRILTDNEGGEVITITTAGERPDVTVGQIVHLVSLEALPWATNGRNGVAFRAESINSAPVVSSVKTA